MEQYRISSRDPGAILARNHNPFAGPADDDPAALGHDDGPPLASGMAFVHLPDIIDPLAPQHPDTAEARTRRLRHDGWTLPKQSAFLERFAECGVVAEACAAVGLSARAAYNLRDRDPLFAAGWDAACLKARPRLADEAFARAMTGVVERIYKDGVIVAERHRHDNKLTMAVLARLDARLDKAQAQACAGALVPHLDLAANWDAFLAALRAGRSEDLAGLLSPPETAPADTAKDRELHELHHRKEAQMADEAGQPKEDDHDLWEDEDGLWWTDYPPPPGFDGEEHGRYHVSGDYRRTLSAAEQAVIDRSRADEIARAAAQRDAFFGFTAAAEEPAFDDDGAQQPAPAAPLPGAPS